MTDQDTIKLLRECDAGIKMGVSSIEDVLDFVQDENFKTYLSDCKSEHEKLKGGINVMLNKYKDSGKEPNAMAKSMSWIKTNAKLAMDESDQTIADLMTDGCNMGVKALNRYLNQYSTADEESRSAVRRLIHIEETMAKDMRPYL